jgi:hypothetical protein
MMLIVLLELLALWDRLDLRDRPDLQELLDHKARRVLLALPPSTLAPPPPSLTALRLELLMVETAPMLFLILQYLKALLGL